MDNETLVAPVVEPGLGADTPSQVSVPAEQSVEQKQEATPAKVESAEAQPQSEDESRARPSDYYRNRKLERELREVKSMISGLTQNLQKPSDPSSQVQDPFKVSDKEFFADPVGVIRKVVETVTKQSLNKDVPALISQQTKDQELNSKLKAAAEYISSRDFFKNDPLAKEKIDEILSDPEEGLSEFQFINPLAAAKQAERIYRERYGQSASQKRNTVVPTKTQLASTATGGATGRNPDASDEIMGMRKEIESNPNIVFDPDFKKRFDSAVSRFNSKFSQA